MTDDIENENDEPEAITERSLRERARWWEYACVAAILVVSVLYHAVTLPGQCLYVDEVAELLYAAESPAEIYVHPDSMPPGFPLTAWATSKVFGAGPQLRWLSVAASLLAMLAVWRLGRRLAGPAAGVASAAVFAALPMQLFYAQFIRAYALETLWAALAIGAAWRAFRHDHWSDWARFALWTVLGMWTHYYFFVVPVSLLVGLVWRRGPRIGVRPIVAAVLIVVGCVPLLQVLEADIEYQTTIREPRLLTPAAGGYTAFSIFSGYALGPSRAELHTMPTIEAATLATPWMVALTACLVPIAIASLARLRRHGGRRFVLPLVLLPVPLLGFAGLFAGTNFHPRFVAWTVVPVALALGAGLAEGFRRPRARRLIAIATGGLCVILLAAIAERNLLDRYSNERVDTAVETIRSSDAHAAVFVYSDYMVEVVRYYWEQDGGRPDDVFELPQPGKRNLVVKSISQARVAVERTRVVVGTRPFWLLASRTFHGDPGGHLREAFEEAGDLQLVDEFPGVAVYRGVLKP